MKPTDLLNLLQEFYREKLALVLRHESGAQRVVQYDFNNTYQYIIGREETQLWWLTAAVTDMGGTVPALDQPSAAPPDAKGADRLVATLRDDVDRMQAFVDRWRDRVEAVTNARQRGMLRVILGETLEHKRFFEQALAGRVDLLGRHPDGTVTKGDVMATRWVE